MVIVMDDFSYSFFAWDGKGRAFEICSFHVRFLRLSYSATTLVIASDPASYWQHCDELYDYCCRVCCRGG